jgi:transcription initiation factor TFIIIB Brf1 subunit/transcription initiation factor TFIIB
MSARNHISPDAVCINCGSNDPPVYNDDQWVCPGCGTVLEEDNLIDVPAISSSRRITSSAAAAIAPSTQASQLLCKTLLVNPKSEISSIKLEEKKVRFGSVSHFLPSTLILNPVNAFKR